MKQTKLNNTLTMKDAEKIYQLQIAEDVLALFTDEDDKQAYINKMLEAKIALITILEERL